MSTIEIATVTAADAALHADVTAVLAAWPAPTPGQAAVREGFLGFLAARPDATRRKCAPGHITASALVLSPDRRQVLLTLHPRLGRWVQLGGHCERRDETLAGAALREATEESGIAGLRIDPVPVHLDIHPVTCSLGIPTRHFDVRFRVVAPAGARPVISDESDDLRFWPVDALPAGFDAGDHELVAAALAG
ncbi:NUDIX hydrolase [Nakamurella sp.]|uniref:NUDIX hydrolase n=1 Tax=Nakamurella sp. TaxID=1869182 RepID=UPI003784EEC9